MKQETIRSALTFFFFQFIFKNDVDVDNIDNMLSISEFLQKKRKNYVDVGWRWSFDRFGGWW